MPDISSPRMVGREAEASRLAGALSRPPAVVLVEGEAGIGKSRLVQEFLASRAARGYRVLVAGCPPVRQPFTLGPVVDALRLAADGVAGLGLSGLAGALRPLFPEWAPGLPAEPDALEDATTARHRVLRALAELLDRLAVTVLVVEDAHWADEATLEFVLFLAARPPGPRRLSLVVTYRPEDVPASSLLRRLSSRLPAGTACARVTLGPLDAAGTASLVSSMLPGGQVSAEFASFLHERTEGIPLAVEESVRLLHDRADLVCQDGQWVRHQLEEIAVPPTVRDAVLERTGRLSVSAQAVLRAAAVLAGPAGDALLVPVSGLGDDEGGHGLAEALGCGLVAEDERGLVSFRHALAARAVYETIPVRQRREMHLRAGQALQGRSPLPLAQLARHFREAGETGETGEWCRYAEQAADRALLAGDHQTAATLLHDLVTEASLPASDAARLTRKVPLDALTGYTRLSDLVHRLRSVLDGDALTLAQRAEVGCQLGRLLFNGGEYEAGTAELERAIPGLAHRPADAAHAMILLGWPNRTLWPAHVHQRWLNRAAEAAESGSIPAGRRLALNVNRVTALLMLGEESAWAEACEMPEDAATPQEALCIAVGCGNIGDEAMRWGRYGQARQRLTAALQLADRYLYPRLRDGALVTLAHLDWFTGAWDGLAERAGTLAELHDTEPLARLEAILIAGLLDAAAGARETAREKLRWVIDEERQRGVVHLPLEPAATLARLCLLEGRAADALALTEEPMQVITRKEIWLWATDIVPARVQALADTGRRDEAAGLVAMFADRMRTLAAHPPQAALTLCRAILAGSQGEHSTAASLFNQAATAWDALPRPYDAMLARERQARCLLAAGQRDDGLALLAEVLRGLSQLGATGDADRVAASLREHGMAARRAWRRGRTGYGDQLSPRELEVVRLVVAGRSNREIAQTLCRSPKTVATQLNSAMRKLSVSTRTALAVRAVEADIVVNGQSRGHAERSSVASQGQ